MKKLYIEPITEIQIQAVDLMLSKESEPNDDPIYGKDRKDDVEGGNEESNSWTNGLW